MLIAIIVVGGLIVAAGIIVAPIVISDAVLDKRDAARHERAWTVEELRAIRGDGDLAPVLAPQLERLPCEDEYEDPQRAREACRRNWADFEAWLSRTLKEGNQP